MFGRIFNRGKDDAAAKSGPPGHRPSQIGGGSSGGAPGGGGGGGSEEPPPMGGGFFNLPPTVAKGPTSYTTPSPGHPGSGQVGGSGSGAHGYHHRPSGGAPHAPPSYSGPTYGAQHPPPANAYGQQSSGYGGGQSGYGASSASQPAYGGGGGGAPAGAMDMFGGMSIKNPAAPPAPHGNGSYGAPTTQPHYGGGYGAPQPPSAAPPASGGGSLFSGLDLGGHTTAPPAYGGEEDASRPVVERKKSGTGTRTGTFNYLDVAAGAAASADPVGQRASMTGAPTQRPSVGGSKVKKKKTKSFRPGFGRQLSDESIAALQRGDLNEEELMQQAAPEEPEKQRSSIATNPTDLAHLLPPVKSGSVLAGLTVHGGGGGGVLAGLTVHGASGPASPKGSMSPPPSSDGGILAGLNVHTPAPVEPTMDASTSVVLPKSRATPQPKQTAPPPEPEKPAAPPTPEERLLNTLRDFHASAVSFRDTTLKQNDEENRILERKVQLAKQLTQYEIDLRDIEAQQQQACEAEDFEKADALNSTLNSVRHCITLTESDVRKVDNELSTFLKAKEKAFSNQLRSTRGTLKELEKFREDQDSERSALREEFKKYEVEETEQLRFEAERIETELHHVSANLDHLSTEKQEIESTIEEQCKTEITLRDELLTARAGVEAEVRELERQLKIKMEQMHEIQSSIDKAEKDIDVVRSRYSRQLKRIADREEGILKTKSEVEADSEHLKEEKKMFTEKIHDYEARIAAFGKRMTAVKKEMRAAMLLASVLEVQETRREQAIVRKKQQTAELTSLSDAAAIAEQSYIMLKKQHDELEKSLSMHRNAIASAEAMIPKLEQEKKEAAAQRNFKEAARISKDIKALEKDQATAEEMVEVVEMELQDLKERIDKRATEFEEKKEELKQVEKQLELSTLQELWKEAKYLRKAIRQIERIKSDGIAAAGGIDFKASALLLVQAEYDACAVQADALEKKYEVTDPAQDEEEEDEVDEDEDDESVDEEEVGRMTDAALYPGAADGDSATAGENGDIDGLAESTLEEIAAKLKELETMIEKATENEDYELAAKLDDKIDALRRRQQSIQALTAHNPGATATQSDVEDEDDDPVAQENRDQQTSTNHLSTADDHDSAGEDEDDDGHNAEELENELRLVQARITMVEADIERATDNEDYDTAASLDDELQHLREELDEIAHLLESARQRESTEKALPANQEVSAAPEPSTSSGSMFEGLGIQSAPPPASPAEPPSLFSGLEVGTSEPRNGTDDAPTDMAAPVPSSPVSMFSGLLVSSSPTEEETGEVGSDEAANVVSPIPTPSSPRRVSVSSGPNSPRRKSSGGMFAGLQVGSTASSPRKQSTGSNVESAAPGSTSSMFEEGLQVGDVVPSPQATTSAPSLFDGLHVDAPVSPRSGPTSPVRSPSPRRRVSAEPTEPTVPTSPSGPSAFFGGLLVNDSGALVDAPGLSSVSLAGDEPVAISSDDAVSETPVPASGGMFDGLALGSTSSPVASSTGMFSGLSLTSESSTILAAAETVAQSSTDLFGGLSLSASPPPIPSTDTAEDDEATN